MAGFFYCLRRTHGDASTVALTRVEAGGDHDPQLVLIDAEWIGVTDIFAYLPSASVSGRSASR